MLTSLARMGQTEGLAMMMSAYTSPNIDPGERLTLPLANQNALWTTRTWTRATTTVDMIGRGTAWTTTMAIRVNTRKRSTSWT